MIHPNDEFQQPIKSCDHNMDQPVLPVVSIILLVGVNAWLNELNDNG
jgi:hypothetical protein